jgi:cytochrome b
MRQLQLPMRIWDLPIRLFHWILVVLLFTSWLSAWRDWMRLHVLCGLTILTLLLFRVIWGLVGSDTARFSHFLTSPILATRQLMRLTRREPDIQPGHNAAGGWMIIAMLAILFVQVGTGLCANDDVLTEGPLARIVGKERSDWLTHIHHLNFALIEFLVATHVVVIIIYRVLKGQNLVLPMITGKKRLPGITRAPRMMHPVLALAIYVFCVVLVAVFLASVGYTP